MENLGDNTVFIHSQENVSHLDDDQITRVDIFELLFGFYDNEFTVYVRAKKLNEDTGYGNIEMHGCSDLFSSFEDKCEDELWDFIKSKCEELQKELIEDDCKERIEYLESELDTNEKLTLEEKGSYYDKISNYKRIMEGREKQTPEPPISCVGCDSPSW